MKSGSFVSLNHCSSFNVMCQAFHPKCFFLAPLRPYFLFPPTRAGNSLIHSSLILIRSFRSDQMSDCERFAQIAQDEWATVSESLRSLRSLRGNERYEQIAHFAHQEWANEWIAHFFGESLIRSFFLANPSFAHFWTKNERFARKSNERIPSPVSWLKKSFVICLCYSDYLRYRYCLTTGLCLFRRCEGALLQREGLE